MTLRILFACALVVGCRESGGSGGFPSVGDLAPGDARGSVDLVATALDGGGDLATSTTDGGGATGDHLLISEISVTPAAAEYVEIYNPTGAAVDLTDYYLSDNAGYPSIAAGMPWNPVTSNPGTDFLARFPPGTMIAAGAVLVVATDPGYDNRFNRCPDFILALNALACRDGKMAAPMVAPMNGGLGDKPGNMLSNDREMVVLFYWDGKMGSVAKDVDYITWGATFDDATRVDKSQLKGYLPDTPRANQKSATAPVAGQSSERCGPALEQGEAAKGGNGITGHDETSEPLDTTFKIQATPSPGAKNGCL